MVDLNHSNPLKCLNNGQYVVNISLNLTYCQCDPCHEGIFCETEVWEQTQFDTTYVHLIIYIIELCLSILNNILSLELFIRCKRIRRTNDGIYLIIYSILSLLSSILLVADGAVEYYSTQLINSGTQYKALDCYLGKIGYNTLVYLCIWFSSCVALEHGLVIYGDRKIKTNRCRFWVTIIVIFAVAVGSATPFLIFKCNWDNMPNLQTARAFFIWFYFSVGVTIYVLATLLVLIGFTGHIRRYGMENNSCIQTFVKLLYMHLFIFIPPIAYVVSYIPYTIVENTVTSDHSYFQCGISTGEYVIKVLIEALQGVPFVITWLLFIFPSKVYLAEFYLSTWSGKRLVKIISLSESKKDTKKSADPSTTIP
jgi:hypothetical protein